MDINERFQSDLQSLEFYPLGARSLSSASRLIQRSTKRSWGSALPAALRLALAKNLYG